MIHDASGRARTWPGLARIAVFCALLVSGASACGSGDRKDSLTLAAYTTPREAYGAVLPAFAGERRRRTGQQIRFRESYLGSGAQVRALLDGFDADVAALALEPEIGKLVDAGLVSRSWNAGPHRGMVTRSVVVIGVREGNPKHIRGWEDLARPGVEVLTPNIRTSGGALWSVLAIYGAAARKAPGTADDDEAAVELLASILRNVRIMDRGARASMLTFERGVGDAVITYENEIFAGLAKGKRYDYVIPSSTLLIENPIAVVDTYARRHGTLELARDFARFARTQRAQRLFAAHGLRPVLASVASETRQRFPEPPDLFTIRDLGGWTAAQRIVFGEGGVYDRAVARSREPSG